MSDTVKFLYVDIGSKSNFNDHIKTLFAKRQKNIKRFS